MASITRRRAGLAGRLGIIKDASSGIAGTSTRCRAPGYGPGSRADNSRPAIHASSQTAPGLWRRALIAVGAALAGAALAILLDRAWAARKAHPATA